MPPKIKVKKVANILYNDREELIKKIEDKSILKEDFKRKPFLFYLAKSGLKPQEKIELYDLLEKNGCDLSQLDDNGNNVYSCIYDKASLLYFLEKGVSLNIKNNAGKPMSSFLNKRDFYMLYEIKKTPDYLLNDERGHNFLFKNGCQLFFEFIDKIENKNFLNSFGENVSFFIPTDKEKISLLLENDISFNIKNHKNETILFSASTKKINLLKELNVIVDLQANESLNPIEKEIIKLFNFMEKDYNYKNDNPPRNNVLESKNKILSLIDYGINTQQITSYYNIIISIKDKNVAHFYNEKAKNKQKKEYIDLFINEIEDIFINKSYNMTINKKRL